MTTARLDMANAAAAGEKLAAAYVGGPDVRDGGCPLTRGELGRGDTHSVIGVVGNSMPACVGPGLVVSGLRAAGAPRTGSRCPG